MPTDPDNNHPSLMFLLLQAYYWFDDALQASIRAAGGPSLPRLQSMVMANVAAGVGRPTHIARNLGVSRQALNHLLTELKRKELIELVPDPIDARAKRVQYHPKSMALVALARRSLADNEAVVLQAEGATRFDDFLSVLNGINDLRSAEIRRHDSGETR